MKVTFYTVASGRSPVWDYLKGVEKEERARVLESLKQIEDFGLGALKTKFRQIEGKLWEIKITAHRIFYVMLTREEMILLHAYKKQSQKLPLKEREIAVRRMKEVLL